MNGISREVVSLGKMKLKLKLEVVALFYGKCHSVQNPDLK
jgi:hypothetical protein